MKRLLRKSLGLVIGLAMLITNTLAVPALPAQAAGVSVTVGCGTGAPTDYADVTTALSHVPLATGGTVTICAGSYPAFTASTYSAPLKIVGKPGAKIVGSGGDYVITVGLSPNVTITGLIVDGAGLNTTSATAGIYYLGAGGTISNNVIRNVVRLNRTDTAGYGVDIQNPVGKLTITQNSIIDTQKAGVYVHGNAGVVTISKNRIFVSGIYGNAPYDIWLDNVAVNSSVVANKLSSDFDDDTSANLYGIFVQGSHNIKVTTNTINNVTDGILLNDCGSASDSSGNSVIANTITDVWVGIQAAANCGGTVNLNQIKSNKIYNNLHGVYGISLAATSGQVDGTTVSANTIYGDWLSFIAQTSDTNTVGISPKQTNKFGDLLKPGS